VATHISIQGLVQGIGFRPFVFTLAQHHQLTGWVKNNAGGITIVIEGTPSNISNFIIDLNDNPPPLSQIHSYQITFIQDKHYTSFSIEKSNEQSNETTELSPDLATCPTCLLELKSDARRIDYPFINCTHCGPRFSIIHDLPYDRKQTTMSSFTMCPHCQKEYDDSANRRFHSQPNACHHCGPSLSLTILNKEKTELSSIFSSIDKLLTTGKCISIKGIGGFHLACNALDKNAVTQLRRRKYRDQKPFALMAKDCETIQRYAYLTDTEKDCISSPANPIVILQKKDTSLDHCSPLNTLGFMLPYTPLHHLLLEKTGLKLLVFTSGNQHDDPIIIDNTQAIEKLHELADAHITHNRTIHNRNDDSIVQVIEKTAYLIRRSRGYAPESIAITPHYPHIFAAGADLKNCFALGLGERAILSQFIGDLSNLETESFYKESYGKFCHIFGFTPKLVAHDAHPHYHSSIWAKALADKLCIASIPIQHHHAHLASVMAEHQLTEKSIGVCFDGTGYGDDNHSWGGEFMMVTTKEYVRYTHLEYTTLFGGDQAAKSPWKIALSYLYATYGEEMLSLPLPFLDKISESQKELALGALTNNINCYQTSSCGRLFDAISALTLVCLENQYEAESAMKLESYCLPKTLKPYALSDSTNIQVTEIVKGVVEDLINGTSASIISTKLHWTLISITLQTCQHMRKTTGINTVLLSGGVFQNRYLLKHTREKLESDQFIIYTNEKVPANDGGLALGQILIASANRPQNQ
jgi:hydrogenase maturation protein HypF